MRGSDVKEKETWSCSAYDQIRGNCPEVTEKQIRRVGETRALLVCSREGAAAVYEANLKGLMARDFVSETPWAKWILYFDMFAVPFSTALEASMKILCLSLTPRLAACLSTLAMTLWFLFYSLLHGFDGRKNVLSIHGPKLADFLPERPSPPTTSKFGGCLVQNDFSRICGWDWSLNTSGVGANSNRLLIVSGKVFGLAF